MYKYVLLLLFCVVIVVELFSSLCCMRKKTRFPNGRPTRNLLNLNPTLQITEHNESIEMAGTKSGILLFAVLFKFSSLIGVGEWLGSSCWLVCLMFIS